MRLVLSTGNDFASENGDFRRSIAIDGIIERDSESVVAKAEVRHRVPCSGDMIRRRVGEGASFIHGGERTE